MDYEIQELKKNLFCMEMLNDMRIDQPVSERNGYIEGALEALSVNAANSKLVANLFKEISSYNNIDYGKIPDSNGDLTRYKYYDQMVRCMDIINEIVKSSNATSEAIITMNKLHNVLLETRDDFVFGYKMNIELIKVVYQNMVLALYEIINDSICDLANQVKYIGIAKVEETKFVRKSSQYVKVANNFIKSYEKAEWDKIVNNFRKNSNQMVGLVISGASIGGALASVAVAIGATVALLLSIRLLVILFYSANAKISEYIRIQTEILNINIINETDDNVVAKQRKMVDTLNHMAGLIEGKRAKTDKVAKATITKSNKENYTKKEVTSYGGLDFQL